MGQQDRAELLLALDASTPSHFRRRHPGELPDRLRPDIWVKGGDYEVASLPEAPLVESWGGRCVTVPYHPARSTTGLADALAKVS